MRWSLFSRTSGVRGPFSTLFLYEQGGGYPEELAKLSRMRLAYRAHAAQDLRGNTLASENLPQVARLGSPYLHEVLQDVQRGRGVQVVISVLEVLDQPYHQVKQLCLLGRKLLVPQLFDFGKQALVLFLGLNNAGKRFCEQLAVSPRIDLTRRNHFSTLPCRKQ